jgi:hypothetical protein
MKYILLLSFVLFSPSFAQEQQPAQAKAEVKKVKRKKRKRRKYNYILETTFDVESTSAINPGDGQNSDIVSYPIPGLRLVVIKPSQQQFSWYGHVGARFASYDFQDLDNEQGTERIALDTSLGAMYKSNIGLISSVRLGYQQQQIATPAINSNIQMVGRVRTVWTPKLSVSVFRSISSRSGVEGGFETILSGKSEAENGGWVIKSGKSFHVGVHQWKNRKRTRFSKWIFQRKELSLDSFIYQSNSIQYVYGWRL